MTEPGVRRLVEVVGERGPVNERPHEQEHGQDREIGVQHDIENLLNHHFEGRLGAPQYAEPDAADRQHGETERKPEKRNGEKDAEADERRDHLSGFPRPTARFHRRSRDGRSAVSLEVCR